ncbi:class I SAM-dependent methyltransferase [Haladaptatus sp. F3-133]|jgi:SAM-dependent methyltransferase|uniref:Class I SAM-dependent methyltransferase n=1 Tax=Halorutilus salinus TaxID=2487751 RepID=A0A9Q4C210_9EURY|nr:class I SAM-dependent methyltransferase [Halorutilus salinus]MCX2817858.1 class I SAM-dependent methyltransferase [Halorutilus salinus]
MEPRSEPFEENTERYDVWFDEHPYAYRSELRALETLVPDDPDGVSVGVGTGRFAVPLGIGTGVDPSERMLERAKERCVETVQGVGEALPFRDGVFGTVLMVTTVCFVDDLGAALSEAHRVLRPGGRFVAGYVDRESALGQRYVEGKEENPFYREATFVSTDEIDDALTAAGFGGRRYVQTLFGAPEGMNRTDEVREGYGDGSFVGVCASRDA